MSTIKVKYNVYSTKWHISKILNELSNCTMLSFDTETKGVYSKAERKAATAYLKGKSLPIDSKALAIQVEANSGLSFPSLVDVTHFIFGISEDESIVIICNDYKLELFIWNWISRYKGLLLIHNTLFDLKLMYHRINKYPQNYEDTQLLAKCLINNVDVWKSKVGLKDLVGEFYDPSWSLFNDYEPDNLKDTKFLNYCGIDGAATVRLWNDIQEHLGDYND